MTTGEAIKLGEGLTRTGIFAGLMESQPPLLEAIKREAIKRALEEVE